MHEAAAQSAPHQPQGFVEASSGTYTRELFDIRREGPGKGSTFRFVLPLAPGAPAAAKGGVA